MKQILNQPKKTGLLACLALASAFMFASCEKDQADLSVGVLYNISSTANGSQATPSNTSAGSGNLSGTYNSTTNVMTYTSTWTNLTSAPIAAAFYNGLSGQVGTSISAWTLTSGLGTSGSFSGSVTLSDEQESQLIAGNWYYLMATTANASGEIRGQISASVQQ